MRAKRPNSVDIAVGRNIKIYRLAKKISQETLGEKIGVTFQQVQKYEKGTNRVGAGRLNQIAHALGITVTKLFEGVGATSERNTDRSAMDLLAEPRAYRLAQAFSEISDSDLRRAIVQLVEDLVPAHKGAR